MNAWMTISSALKWRAIAAAEGPAFREAEEKSFAQTMEAIDNSASCKTSMGISEAPLAVVTNDKLLL
jgi:hypothetical protein